MPKKRQHPDLETLLERPWCYYCEREFDDLVVLVNHQKAKHYKCERCNRRLSTIGGLQVHLSQVHKENLTSIENALPNRQDLNIEIFGVTGVPTEVLNQRTQRIVTEYQEAQAVRQAATGNPPPGSGSNPHKKLKTEDKSSLKERLAAHRAAKKATETNSGENTPTLTTATSQSPGISVEQVTSAISPVGFAQPYSAPPPAGYSGFPPSVNIPYAGPSPLQPSATHSHMPSYSPVGSTFPHHPILHVVGLPSPGAYQNPRQTSPSQPPSLTRSPSLPPGPPGLPQKPAFAAPPVNQFQLMQMHQGFYANQQRVSYEGQANAGNVLATDSPGSNHISATTADIDELVADAAKSSKLDAATLTSPEGVPVIDVGLSNNLDKKIVQKEKEKKIKLVYTDNEVSPEEKMAMLPRYSKYFGLAQSQRATALTPSIEMSAGLTGVISA